MDSSQKKLISHADALAAFNPERFGLRPFHNGWLKEDNELGPIVFCELGWEHAQAPSYDYDGYDRRDIDALTLVVRLQARVWGMPGEELVPVNLLAVLRDTGGALLVAYQLAKGFNYDGWLGFVIGAGSPSGTFVSHMLGVHETVRGARDIGWYLKVVQAYIALRNGHTKMQWTFDPMRGANARLNLEKLGAVVDELSIDKYGILRSVLYGDVPSDRFTARWDLHSTATYRRLFDVHTRVHHTRLPSSVSDLPELTTEASAVLRARAPMRMRYRIPGDIDALMQSDPAKATHWRQEMREVLTGLLPTKTRVFEDVESDGPAAISVHSSLGDYRITGFASGLTEAGERDNYYVLERGRTNQ